MPPLYILDSDHLSLYQRGYEPIKNYLLTIPSEQIAITIISAEELIRGRLAQIRKATKPQNRVYAYHWLSKTFDFLCNLTIVEYSSQQKHIFKRFVLKKSGLGHKI